VSEAATIATTAATPEVAVADHNIIRTLPILVLFPHNRCNCRCLMCDIWRIRQVREITAQDLKPHLESLHALRVRWVVFSGGEPQMHSDLPALSGLIRAAGIHVTLLTAGLLLEPYARSITETVDDVIVSLDGPPAIHDQIRRVPRAFERLRLGVDALRTFRPEIVVRGRSTVQKVNYSCLRETVQTAKYIGLNSISFLAVDLSSEAFNRPGGWTPQRQTAVGLEAEEVNQLEHEVESLISEDSDDIARGYIAESPGKLRRIVRHFRAHLGEAPAVAPLCNAPWVSAVVEADGTVRPCFFHPTLGNIREKTLVEVLNSEQAIGFRRRLHVASNPICQRCVCSLRLAPETTSSAPNPHLPSDVAPGNGPFDKSSY
jgi:Fe-coproporphyrin III synthase